jgi:uncharacterized protein (TIGR00369 family)
MDPGVFAAFNGLDALQGYEKGWVLPPPVHYLYGQTIVRVEPDTALFTMPASPWLLPPQGVISGATLALLADGPLGCAVQTALPAATPYTTSEISMTFLRPVAADNRLLTGTGRLIHAGRSLAVSEATITDADGNVVALTSTRCVVLPKMEFPVDFVEHARANPPQPHEPDWPTPHPYLRPVEGAVLPQESWDRMTGLEVMQACSREEIPPPPMARLLGVWPVEVEEGRTTWTMPATEWLCSPAEGRLYGGAIAFMAGNAIDGTLTTLTPPGAAIAPLDLKVYFLRPVPPDGRDLTAKGQVIHRGRTLAIGSSEVFDADGKRVAIATASAMMLRGRPAALARPVEAREAAEL